MNEQRNATRWNVVLPVRYKGITTSKEGAARTRDLSTQGVRLEMVERHNPGDRMDMLLEIPGSRSGSVCVEADVVWQKAVADLQEECNYLTGLVFSRIRDCHKQSILDYIIDNHPDQHRQKWWDGL